MRRINSGFTIIEILVVVAVIGILATISLVGFNRYQADTRDAQRSSKATILSEALEKYYDQNGEYPSCPAITALASTVTTTTLPGVESNTLLTPQSAAGDTNSIECQDLTNISQADIFAYVGDGSAACNSGQVCLSWTLKYKEESTNTIKAVQSRRQTAIATSGTSTLTASGAGFTQVNASWDAIDNAISYEVQRATNAGFTTNLGTQTVTGVSAAITGLTYNTNYYVRVRPNAAIGQGNWSNTATAATWTLTQPTLSAVAQSFTQINTSWGKILHATSYEVQRATDSGFTANLVTQTAAVTTSNFTGLAYNTTYYFRARALATTSPVPGAWSGTDTEPTWGLSTPSTAAVTTSNTTFTSSWGTILHAASYNVQCSSNGSTWSGCTGSTTGLSFGWGPTWQGTPLYFRTQAANGSYVSAWSNTAGATTGIDAPVAYSMDYGNTSATWNFLNATSNAVCPSGTTPSYDWYYNGGNFWVSGTQYRSVSWQYSDWNQSITLSVASRCIKGAVSSGFTWTSNFGSGSLLLPTVWANVPSYRTAAWSGVCPTYTTSYGYYWRVHGMGTVGDMNGGPTLATSWNGTAYTWGDGTVRATLHCVGPWGTVGADSAPAAFGAGCVSQPYAAACYW